MNLNAHSKTSVLTNESVCSFMDLYVNKWIYAHSRTSTFNTKVYKLLLIRLIKSWHKGIHTAVDQTNLSLNTKAHTPLLINPASAAFSTPSGTGQVSGHKDKRHNASTCFALFSHFPLPHKIFSLSLSFFNHTPHPLPAYPAAPH